MVHEMYLPVGLREGQVLVRRGVHPRQLSVRVSWCAVPQQRHHVAPTSVAVLPRRASRSRRAQSHVATLPRRTNRGGCQTALEERARVDTRGRQHSRDRGLVGHGSAAAERSHALVECELPQRVGAVGRARTVRIPSPEGV